MGFEDEQEEWRKVQQLKFTCHEQLQDVPDHFVAVFIHLFSQNLEQNKNVANYLKEMYNKFKVLDEIL